MTMREQWLDRELRIMKERMAHATKLFDECVDIDHDVRGGVPVLKGTRVPVSMILAEIANGESVMDVASNRDLDASKIAGFLHSLSIGFDQSYTKPQSGV